MKIESINSFLTSDIGLAILEIAVLIFFGGTIRSVMLANKLVNTKALLKGFIKAVDSYKSAGTSYSESQLDKDIAMHVMDYKINNLSELKQKVEK